MSDFRSDLPLGTDNPAVLKANAGNLDESVNNPEPATWRDRFGNERKNMAAVEQSAPIASAAADRAAEYADAAEASAAAAASAGSVYPDSAAGVAPGTGVEPGRYFWVVSENSSDVLELWQNVGGTAVDTGKRQPSSVGVQGAVQGNAIRLNSAGYLAGWVDPFFRYLEIEDEFDGLPRWRGTAFSSWSLSENPVFGGRALRKTVPAVAENSGPMVYLSDMDAQPGDAITLRVLVIGSGAGARLIANVLSESGATVGSALTSIPNVVVTSGVPQLMTIEAVMPASAHRIYIRPTTTVPGDVFDIVAFWAYRGEASAGPDWPTFHDDQYAATLARSVSAATGTLFEAVGQNAGRIQEQQAQIEGMSPAIEAVSPFIESVSEPFNVVLSTGYLRRTDGQVVSVGGASYRTSQLLPCSPGDEVYVTVYTQSTLMAGYAFYDAAQGFISAHLQGTSTGVQHNDLLIEIPESARYFAVCGYNTAPPSARKVVGRELDVFSREQSDSRYMPIGAQSPQYGIRWAVDSLASSCERTGAAVGLVSQSVIGTGAPAGANSFDSIYPWSAMKRCAVRVLSSGAVRLLYEGDSGYAEDGSAGDIFIEIPRFGYERRVDNGYEYRTVAREGLPAHPAFVESGRVLDHIYVAAYNAAEAEGKLQSLPGTLPTMNQVAQAFLDKATAKGRGFTLLDMRTVDALQNLLWIEHATRNSTTVIGRGWAELKQAQVATWKFVAAEPAANRWIMEQPITANNKEQLFVGQDIVICDTAQTNIIARRKITSVEYDSPASGQTAVYFDGAPIDTTAAMFAGSCPQQSGQADAMSYHTGRLDRPKTDPSSTIPRDELNPNRYRWMENLVGDVWRLLPDVTFIDGVMYVCDDMTQYEFHASTGAYRPVAIEPPLQTNNDDGHWVHALALDRLSPRIAIAQFEGAGDHMSRFGAFWYLNPGPVVIAQGGGFDHKKRCNLLTYRAWIEPTRQWYLYGARLQFKAI